MVIRLNDNIEVAVSVQVGQAAFVGALPAVNYLLAKIAFAIAPPHHDSGVIPGAGGPHLADNDIEVAIQIDISHLARVPMADDIEGM